MKVTIEIDDDMYKLFETQAGLLGMSLEDHVAFLLRLQAAPQMTRTGKRNLGWAAGMGIKMSDDFDEPLEEFKDYM